MDRESLERKIFDLVGYMATSGQNLIDEGVSPGPHIGRALRLTRDALIDDMIAADEALRWALETARSLETEMHS